MIYSANLNIHLCLKMQNIQVHVVLDGDDRTFNTLRLLFWQMFDRSKLHGNLYVNTRTYLYGTIETIRFRLKMGC